MSATSKKASRFAKGSGCFKCLRCGKLTRATGRGDHEHNGTCADCYDRGGDENAVLDGTMTQAEFNERWPEHKKEEPKAEPAVGGIDKWTKLTIEHDEWNGFDTKASCGAKITLRKDGARKRWVATANHINTGTERGLGSCLVVWTGATKDFGLKEAQAAAAEAFVAVRDTTQEQWDAAEQADRRGKLVRHLVDGVRDAERRVAESVDELREYLVVQGYQDAAHKLGKVCDAEAELWAAWRVLQNAVSAKDAADLAVRLSDLAMQTYASAHSTSMHSNARDLARGDALRSTIGTVSYSDRWEQIGKFDLLAALKAAAPELFEEKK